MSAYRPKAKTDLINCEDEPIHLTTYIQSFGFLMAISLPEYQIVQCSANTEEFIEFAPAQLIDKKLPEILPKEAFEEIRELSLDSKILYSSPIDLEFLPSKKVFKVNFHFSQGFLILEGEPFQETIHGVSYYTASNHFVKQLNTSKNLGDLSNIAATFIKEISDYDRVMIYEFDREWNGQVIAESRENNLYPFLGHYFPASDIPAQARKLYLENLLRIIPDVDYTPVELITEANSSLKAPLDLSQAILRSTSPLHIEYLQNMGVRATLTISIIINHQLWGLVACHHHTPKYTNSRLRNLLEHFGHLLAHQIQIIKEIDRKSWEIKIQENEKSLIKIIAQEQNFFKSLYNNLPLLLSLQPAQGIIVSNENNFCKHGSVPDKKFVNQLIDWLFKTQSESVFHTHCLSEQLSEAAQHTATACGILAIRLSKYEKNFIIWFKPETRQSITWGGNPNEKDIKSNEDGSLRLSPRKSFEKWEQVVKNKAIKWEQREIRLAESFRYFLIELIANQTSFLESQKLSLAMRVQEKTLEIRQAHLNLQKINDRIIHQNEELRRQNEEIIVLYKELDKHKTKLKAVLDNTKHVFLYLDLGGKLLFFNELANKKAQDILNKKLKIGDSLQAFTKSPREQKRLDQAFQKALRGRFVIIESIMTDNNSQKRNWFRIEFNPIKDEDKVKGIVVLMVDITELKEASLLIEEQNKNLREIAYIQSHEVRKPVANIIGLIGLFNHDDPSDSFNKVVLDKLDVSIKDLDKIIGKIVENTYSIHQDVKKIAHE